MPSKHVNIWLHIYILVSIVDENNIDVFTGKSVDIQNTFTKKKINCILDQLKIQSKSSERKKGTK